MSNIKRIEFRGFLPYDAPNRSEVLSRFLAQCIMPQFGFKIMFSDTHYFKMENGGQYCHYYFSLGGDEAVRDEYLTDVIGELCAIGRDVKGKWADIEFNPDSIKWHLIK